MGLSYVAGIQPNTLMWPSGAGPKRRGKPLNNTGRRDEPDLISAKELGLALPKHAWRAIRWREGSAHWIDAGALPVGENDRLVGMITDRDITVRAVGAGKGPDTPIREVMSKDVRYCFEDDELDEVAENMADIKVRRLPVLNRDKRLVGILSLGDIALTEGAGSAGSALCGISEPGGEHSQSIDGGRAGRAAR
jgi:CBS domain-containing protein